MKQQVPYLGLLVLSILNFPKHLYTNQNFRLKTLQPINSCVSSTLCWGSCFPFGRLFKAMILFSVSINPSSDIKDISKMICNLKFTFAWILFLPQLTGNVFYRDCDRILWVFTFHFGFIVQGILFYFDSSRLLCLLECIRCLNWNQRNSILVWMKSKVSIVVN